jgi:hypothetical protein
MIRIIILFILISLPEVYSQNLQIHYDFGENRNYITTTIEMFKPDDYGATFFFVDFDYNLPGNKSMSLAYFEIARYISVYRNLSLTVQYNDGFIVAGGEPFDIPYNIAFTLNQTWLGGISYPVNLGFVTLNTDILYRNTYGSEAPDAQITIVWFVPFLNNKINFTGFLDFWSQDISLRNPFSTSDRKEMVFLAEPQIWYNIFKHLAVGTELEVSNNFLPTQRVVKIMPTLAVKWNF